MTYKQAITRADTMRPNMLREEHKADWLNQLDGRFAETMGVDAPASPWPNDGELLIGHPYDSVYEQYLCAMIDHANQDFDLYETDHAMFNATWDAARAWWRRHHKPGVRV